MSLTPTEPPGMLGKKRSGSESQNAPERGQGSRSGRSAALQSRTPTNRQNNPYVARKIENNRRAAKETTCRRCGTPILVGLDDDHCAMTARADTTPVDPLHEAIAILTGLRTYDLVRGELFHRDQWHTTSRRPRRHPVLTEHRCTP